MLLEMPQDEFIPVDCEVVECYTAASIALYVMMNINSDNIKLKQIEGYPNHLEVFERRNEYSKWKSIGIMREDLFNILLML